MFRKVLGFRSKRGDGGQLRRSQGPTSQAPISRSSQSSISDSIQKDDVKSTAPHIHPPQCDSETDSEPLGLQVIYTPRTEYKANIVFIHGLGGTGRLTWSKYKNPKLFWPMEFLPLESDISSARIFTFAYNANFHKAGNVNISVLDFAKDLLFDLRYAKDKQKKDLNMESVPLIFVVHSMGGLIAKEAYVQGQIDPEYQSIIKRVSAIIFLATPHRGTGLAEILNRILQYSAISNSKQYVSDLAKNSFALQKLNEQFRHFAPRLDIVSFYETQPTSLGFKNVRITIVEKESSVLGYPGEISRALNADHHGVCKFDSPSDPNYIAVRNVLKSLVSKAISTKESNRISWSDLKESRSLKSLLAITELPDVDFIYFRDQWTKGTCTWVLEDTSYLRWLDGQEPGSSLLWLRGGAGTGKSVLSSFVVNSLVERGLSCQYFFIKYGEERKRTLSFLLRSIAYQMAEGMPSLLQSMAALVDLAIDFGTANPKTIWDRVFKCTLFDIEQRQTFYWIIDGLDEADEPQAIIELLSEISSLSVQIRILLVGRQTSEIVTAFKKAPKPFYLGSINIEGHSEDLCHYIHQELSIPGTTEFKGEVVQRILAGARNNFLWVRLTIDNLNQCHTRTDIEIALQQPPAGMEALYDRMAASVVRTSSLTGKALALSIIQSVSCSLRILTVPELLEALHEDAFEVLDLERFIVDLCGGFVVIDNGGNVAMIHQTAREYILSGNCRFFSAGLNAAHKQMFLSCMQCLMSTNLRTKVNQNKQPLFVDYAATYWSSHLVSSTVDSNQVLEVLNKFLTGHWILTWIQVLALRDQLPVLVQASKHLSRYSLEQKVNNAAWNGEARQAAMQNLIPGWVVDFTKLVGRFSSNLRRNPASIHKLIPPFCPRESQLYQLFGKKEIRSLTVVGLSATSWDDLVGCISAGSGNYFSAISAAGAQIVTLAPSGSVSIYNSTTFEEAATGPIRHGERLYRMELNSTGALLVTYGYRTTKVWEISSGKCRNSIDNIDSRPRPLAMLLIHNDTVLLVGTEDGRLRSLNLNVSAPTWQLVAELEEPELEGHFLNSSSYMAMNKDATLIAVAYRGHPLSAWEIDGPVHIGHCWRSREQLAKGEVIEAVWHPHLPELLGLYIEGVVFKWCPYDTEPIEAVVGASRLAISDDGNLFATGDVHGTVKVFTTASFCLLHRLISQDIVLGLAFSPDSYRLHDIRGYYGNVWEPSALAGFKDQKSQGGGDEVEAENIIRESAISTSRSQTMDVITVLASSPLGCLYCYGTIKGVVRLYDKQRGKIADIYKSKGLLSIGALCWSNNGRYICFSNQSRKLFVVSIAGAAGSSDTGVEQKAEIAIRDATNGSILQLLSHPNSSHLLVHTFSAIWVVSLSSFQITHSLEWDSTESKWLTHLQDPTLIIGVDPNALHILDWDLIEHQTYRFENPSPQSISSSQQENAEQNTVEKVLLTRDTKHLLVQTSLLSYHSRVNTFSLFETSSFSSSITSGIGPTGESHSTTLNLITLPKDLTSRIASALLFISRGRLIFLSKDFSICSWQLPLRTHASAQAYRTTINSDISALTLSESSMTLNHFNKSQHSDTPPITELFSLPGDWIRRDCLALCSIWAIESSFLCPKNGEVAIVRCAGLS